MITMEREKPERPEDIEEADPADIEEGDPDRDRTIDPLPQGEDFED